MPKIRKPYATGLDLDGFDGPRHTRARMTDEDKAAETRNLFLGSTKQERSRIFHLRVFVFGGPLAQLPLSYPWKPDNLPVFLASRPLRQRPGLSLSRVFVYFILLCTFVQILALWPG